MLYSFRLHLFRLVSWLDLLCLLRGIGSRCRRLLLLLLASRFLGSARRRLVLLLG